MMGFEQDGIIFGWIVVSTITVTCYYDLFFVSTEAKEEVHEIWPPLSPGDDPILEISENFCWGFFASNV